MISAVEQHICKIANVGTIKVEPADGEAPEDVMSAVIKGAEILVPLDELVDIAAEIARLEKEQKRLEGEVTRVEKKLSNQGFVSKAPAAVVEEEKAKGEKYKEMLETVVARLESLR
jgi:valyl-tRNA synthetase